MPTLVPKSNIAGAHVEISVEEAITIMAKIDGWRTQRLEGHPALYCSINPLSGRGRVAYGSPRETQADYPNYLNDANAAMAVLAKMPSSEIVIGPDYRVRIFCEPGHSSRPHLVVGQAVASTLCQAVCTACAQADYQLGCIRADADDAPSLRISQIAAAQEVIPKGWLEVLQGGIRQGDQLWDAEVAKFVDISPFALGMDVCFEVCVIRRIPDYAGGMTIPGTDINMLDALVEEEFCKRKV